MGGRATEESRTEPRFLAQRFNPQLDTTSSERKYRRTIVLDQGIRVWV